MSAITWGLLGPERLASERRTRTLQLGATVRFFNDRAVPGMGGVWFGKQLFLAALGIAVAEGVRGHNKRASNIEVANAIEALACWLALKSTAWRRDPRLRGATKMRGKTDLSFAQVRKPSFYVTQPMRRATIQPLRALGLVESSGERFNGFTCTQAGLDFIEAVCADHKPHKHPVLDHLVGWAKGEHNKVTGSPPLEGVLSPLEPMPDSARELLRSRLVQDQDDDAARRRKALDWVDSLRDQPQQITSWSARPAMLSEAHWRDLHAGALFFDVRNSALAVLDQIETYLGASSHPRLTLKAQLPESIASSASALRSRAQAFLNNHHDPSPGLLANAFCEECIQKDDASLLPKLVLRDGRGLRLLGADIVPGSAFRGGQAAQGLESPAPEEEGAESETPGDVPLPEGISHRMHNLYWLNLDLRGELNDSLNPSEEKSGVAP